MYNRYNSGNSGDIETLRQQLLDEVCAGAFSGFDAMILDADRIRRANSDELEEIARQYGF